MIFGAGIGGTIGFLLRPSLMMIGQLPFEVVLTRGTRLSGVEQIFLVQAAEQSFNYLLIGIILGGVVGWIASQFLPQSD